MKKKDYKLTKSRVIYIYNKLHGGAGMSYPALAKEMDIPVIQAFKLFGSVEAQVKRNDKLRLRAMCHYFAKNEMLGDRTYAIFENHDIPGIREAKSKADKNLKEFMKEVNDWADTGYKTSEIIFLVLKELKGE